MLKQLFCYCQYLLPQHLLSVIMGKLANSRVSWVKNTLIDFFCYKYPINLEEAVIQNPHDYPTFNDFFTRSLKPDARPVASEAHCLVSPADGTIAQTGKIEGQQLLQAKGMYFNLSTLLGGQSETAALFENGSFATVYLAPHNYHQVHMPFTGTLRQSIYIPGRLFSVNRMTSELIPNLYARNERLVLIFDTEAGPMAVIMVGAMIVGSMQTVWMTEPVRGSRIEVTQPVPQTLEKGAELGRFLMGSTVILLLPQQANWLKSTGSEILTGQPLASLSIS